MANMPFMSVTDDTSQESRGRLKARALVNMRFMSVTDETSQESRGRLKE